METVTILIVLGVVVALFFFRKVIPKVIGFAVVAIGALWLWNAGNGDPGQMLTVLWDLSAQVLGWLQDFGNEILNDL